jgi:nucleoside-diphosphate-sugar epimerase
MSLNSPKPGEAQADKQACGNKFVVAPDDLILITGATGFIGSRVVQALFRSGFRNLVCLARSTSDRSRLDAVELPADAKLKIVTGNLLSQNDCATATAGVSAIIHLAAGGSDKSYPDAFMNCVITTRNLLEAGLQQGCLRRFVNISSLAVYSNQEKQSSVLDESSPLEKRPELRGDAYCFAKIKQDELVIDYSRRTGLSYVIVRPGSVYGPGKGSIPSRVGIDTFGMFLHLGGWNKIPFTYVDNCAEAIVMAGLSEGTNGEVFNVVDDDLPSSRKFLRLYKHNVKKFRSIYMPHWASYVFCRTWERYSQWSEGQLPPVFNRRRWHALWKSSRYSNRKLKTQVGWRPAISMADGLDRYLQSCRERGALA